VTSDANSRTLDSAIRLVELRYDRGVMLKIWELLVESDLSFVRRCS
jgi:hypothetical protein